MKMRWDNAGRTHVVTGDVYIYKATIQHKDNEWCATLTVADRILLRYNYVHKEDAMKDVDVYVNKDVVRLRTDVINKLERKKMEIFSLETELKKLSVD